MHPAPFRPPAARAIAPSSGRPRPRDPASSPNPGVSAIVVVVVLCVLLSTCDSVFVTISPSSVYVSQGEELYLSCNISEFNAVDESLYIYWKHESDILEEYKMETTGEVGLSICDVTETDTGHYYCILTDDDTLDADLITSTSYSKSVLDSDVTYVTVTVGPSVISVPDNMTVLDTWQIDLYVEMDGVPQPEINIFFDNQDITDTLNFTSNVFSMIPTHPDSTGWYTVTGTNSEDTISGYFYLQTVASQPSPIVTDESYTTITVDLSDITLGSNTTDQSSQFVVVVIQLESEDEAPTESPTYYMDELLPCDTDDADVMVVSVTDELLSRVVIGDETVSQASFLYMSDLNNPALEGHHWYAVFVLQVEVTPCSSTGVVQYYTVDSITWATAYSIVYTNYSGASVWISIDAIVFSSGGFFVIFFGMLFILAIWFKIGDICKKCKPLQRLPREYYTNDPRVLKNRKVSLAMIEADFTMEPMQLPCYYGINRSVIVCKNISSVANKIERLPHHNNKHSIHRDNMYLPHTDTDNRSHDLTSLSSEENESSSVQSSPRSIPNWTKATIENTHLTNTPTSSTVVITQPNHVTTCPIARAECTTISEDSPQLQTNRRATDEDADETNDPVPRGTQNDDDGDTTVPNVSSRRRPTVPTATEGSGESAPRSVSMQRPVTERNASSNNSAGIDGPAIPDRNADQSEAAADEGTGSTPEPTNQRAEHVDVDHPAVYYVTHL